MQSLARCVSNHPALGGRLQGVRGGNNGSLKRALSEIKLSVPVYQNPGFTPSSKNAWTKQQRLWARSLHILLVLAHVRHRPPAGNSPVDFHDGRKDRVRERDARAAPLLPRRLDRATEIAEQCGDHLFFLGLCSIVSGPLLGIGRTRLLACISGRFRSMVGCRHVANPFVFTVVQVLESPGRPLSGDLGRMCAVAWGAAISLPCYLGYQVTRRAGCFTGSSARF
jgi:hypothetical protein